MNKLLSLGPGSVPGHVAASSGNHGAAVAYGLKRLIAGPDICAGKRFAG
jgi:threonine dehydratase